MFPNEAVFVNSMGDVLANNFANLISSPLAEVYDHNNKTVSDQKFWSGSDDGNGTLSKGNCADFTTAQDLHQRHTMHNESQESPRLG